MFSHLAATSAQRAHHTPPWWGREARAGTAPGRLGSPSERSLRSGLSLRTMLRLVRLLTLVLAFASVQLTLLAGGPGCPMPTSEATRSVPAAGADDMRGMNMNRSTATGVPGESPSAPADQPPCDYPTAPQACQTMAPCLFAALVPVATVEALEGHAPSLAIATLVLTPPSETPAPELPPPRA